MPFSLSQTAVPAFTTGLTALSGLLDKAAAFAAAKKIEPSVLLQSRLAPDMFPLLKQVQIAADFGKNTVSRLAGVDPPRHEDTETSIEELKERIAKSLAIVKAADAGKIDGAGAREITFPLGPNNKGQMRGEDYLVLFALPNFYFHLTTAYAILRHNGMELGKQDFLGSIPMKMS
jgi:hypothetical protein